MRLPKWLGGEPKAAPARSSGWVSDMLTGVGGVYMPGYTTTYEGQKAERIGNSFPDFVEGGLFANAIVSACELVRTRVFSEARFQYQQLRGGRPGDLFGDPSLGLLEKPWPGGTTGDLLVRMLLDADMAGNFYGVVLDGEIVRLRPDWVEIILEPRDAAYGPELVDVTVGMRRVGYMYWEGGKYAGDEPAYFPADEVCHFAPWPDPLLTYMGRSLLTSVVREIQADGMATRHKLSFFENAATPNLAVSLKEGLTPDQFNDFVDKMDASHRGAENAYKTLYTANGADVSVIGANMQQLDFKSTQGAGETRIAAAMRVHPVLVGLSEGMSGSSLNAGNYQSAKRSFADGEMRPLWRNAAGSLEAIVPPPPGARLWYDDRDVAYLREDQKDAAEIQSVKALSIRQLVDAGYKPESVIKAIDAEDFSLLTHSNLFSVQLQEPGAGQPAADQPIETKATP